MLHPQDTFVGLIGDAKTLFGDPSHALSAAIYTEVSDVEDELNGIITYDRQARTTLPDMHESHVSSSWHGSSSCLHGSHACISPS